ncbi:MAG: substrate-binding domain-containing protein [Lentisphaeria bacterium]|nr:substrate-binding domain-containing protein [Lentisphaeria bacterium]
MGAVYYSQLCDIYSGKIKNWKDVGGKDQRIRVIRREDGDSSLAVLLKTLPGFKDITLTKKSKTTLSDPITVEIAGKTAGAIAFGTYPNVIVNNNVHHLALGKLKATDADYPCVGSLALIFKEKNKKGNLGKFIDFVSTKLAKEAITKAGAIPIAK